MIKPTTQEKFNGGRSLAFRDIKDTNDDWRFVLHLGRQSRHAKGEYLPEKGLLFLDRGKVSLVVQNQDGAEKILWYIHEGCIFGEVAFFDPLPPEGDEGDLLCVTDCVIYTFSRQAVERIGKEQPELLINLFHSMARKLRIASYHASSLYLDDGLARVCKFLSHRLVPGSRPLTAKIGISRQEMASLIGMHRISLYRVLRQQEEEGLFAIKGNTVTILRPPEFYELAAK